jgi:hypothetical protein
MESQLVEGRNLLFKSCCVLIFRLLLVCVSLLPFFPFDSRKAKGKKKIGKEFQAYTTDKGEMQTRRENFHVFAGVLKRGDFFFNFKGRSFSGKRVENV